MARFETDNNAPAGSSVGTLVLLAAVVAALLGGMIAARPNTAVSGVESGPSPQGGSPRVTIQRVDAGARGPLERVVGFVLADGTIRTVDEVFGPIDYVDVASIGVEFGCSNLVLSAGD